MVRCWLISQLFPLVLTLHTGWSYFQEHYSRILEQMQRLTEPWDRENVEQSAAKLINWRMPWRDNCTFTQEHVNMQADYAAAGVFHAFRKRGLEFWLCFMILIIWSGILTCLSAASLRHVGLSSCAMLVSRLYMLAPVWFPVSNLFSWFCS